MIEQINTYLVAINASTEVVDWISTTGKKALVNRITNVEELEHIADYLVSPASSNRLKRMSFKDAKRLAEAWSKSNQKKGKNILDSEDDIEIIHDFLDGTKIVKLKTKKAYQREGFLMGHCSGGYPVSENVHLYSYRDNKNMPHATFEVQKNNNEIVQIKGKGNGPIHPRYIHPILAFLKAIGMDIRSSDMKNLGYYHLHKDHMDFLKKSDAWKQVTMINGEAYAHN